MAFTAAHAVNDLPGGPAVNQLNLHPAVTKIAQEQAWLHWFMLILSTVIFVAVFTVMFYYNLNTTLLMKSLLMVGAGIIFLAIGYALKRIHDAETI